MKHAEVSCYLLDEPGLVLQSIIDISVVDTAVGVGETRDMSFGYTDVNMQCSIKTEEGEVQRVGPVCMYTYIRTYLYT